MNAIILSAFWGVAMMYTGIVTRKPSVQGIVAIIGMILLVISSWLEFIGIQFFDLSVAGMLRFGMYENIFILAMSVCGLVYLLLSVSTLEQQAAEHMADHLALIFFVMTGLCIVSGFESLLMLFLGIEILSIPLFILAASDKRNLKSNEAALKYFLMGSFSTGLMLMGIALLYGTHGSFNVEAMNVGKESLSPLAMAGILLVLVSMAFKVSAAPFHFWTPDVYDGTPVVYTSFMATIVKAAAFFAFLRLFQTGFSKIHSEWQLLLAVITAATLVIGNVTAVFQQSVKRMLAYSSIAQAGFMMLAVFALNFDGRMGIVLYAVAYSLATIGIFAVLSKMKDPSIEAFNGLATYQPTLALLMTIFFLSLAGIPLTVGFFAKYYMILAALKTGQMTWLIILALLCAAVSVYYYFRVIQAMYFRTGEDTGIVTSKGFRFVLAGVAIIILILGIHPDWFVQLLTY